MILAIGGPVSPLSTALADTQGTLVYASDSLPTSMALLCFIFLPDSRLFYSCLSLHLLLGLKNSRDLVNLLVTHRLKTSPLGIIINHTF